MERLDQALNEILINVDKSMRLVDRDQAEGFLRSIIDANRVFVVGQGRSGLVARAFSMRLMHLGIRVYVIGETITPAIEAGDLLIAVSGSGTTSFVVSAATTAKKLGAKTAAITSYADSPLGKISDSVVIVKGRTASGEAESYTINRMIGRHEPLAPLGTIFELSAMVFLDSAIVELMRKMNKTEDDMRRLHNTIE